MEFAFRAGDRRPRRASQSPDRRFTPPQAGPFHGEPPPSPFEREAAARRERIIREEVERRLIEEEVQRELAVARARFHGGFGPAPFVGPVMPPPPAGPFFIPDGAFMPPWSLPMMPVAMRPNCPPPALFGSWEGFGPRGLPGFGQPMHPNETRTMARHLPPPKPRHQLRLREIAPHESSEVLSSETMTFSVKRKTDASSATTKPTKLQNASSATTETTKPQTAMRDWSCALCQVSATSEVGFNQHLQGKKHKAKLIQCGAIKVINANKNGLQVTTGNNNGAGPNDAPKKIHILVDGEMHQVVQKSNCVWCERCRVSCTNAAAMADHLRGKKHSLLNKVWTSIKAVRMNKEVKEDPAGTYEREVNENGPTRIPEEDEPKEEDTYMISEFNEDGCFETPMKMKETSDMVEEVDANNHDVIPIEIKKEYTNNASKVIENCAGETKQEDTDVDVVNFLLNAHQKSRNKANNNFLLKIHQKSRKKAYKNFLSKVHQKSRKKAKKANKNFLLKVHEKPRPKKWFGKVHEKPRPKKWFGIRKVNENNSVEIPAEERHNDEPTDSTEAPRKEE